MSQRDKRHRAVKLNSSPVLCNAWIDRLSNALDPTPAEKEEVFVCHGSPYIEWGQLVKS